MYAESVNIYVLIDPLDHEVRYVGKTWQSLNRRLADHCRTDRPNNSHKFNWIMQLLRWGYKPLIQLLQVVPVEVWEEAEQYWIGYFRSLGCDLTNGTLGGDGGNSPTEATRQRQREVAKRNWELNPHVPISDETREKMSLSHKGQVRTPEQRQRISESKRGKKREPFSEEWRFKLGAHEREMTHCGKGHEFTPENTRISTQGKRVCKTCDAERSREYRERKKLTD